MTSYKFVIVWPHTLREAGPLDAGMTFVADFASIIRSPPAKWARLRGVDTFAVTVAEGVSVTPGSESTEEKEPRGVTSSNAVCPTVAISIPGGRGDSSRHHHTEADPPGRVAETL